MSARQNQAVRQVDGLFALAEQLESRLAKARGQVEKLAPSILARTRTPSLPARPGCALSLRAVLFRRSQGIHIAGKFAPQEPTEEPASALLERIRSLRESCGKSV